MKWREWKLALDEGRIIHDWTPLHVEHNGHVAELQVSADAVRVRDPNDWHSGIREGGGAFAAQLLADALGGLMITDKLLELRHDAATVQLNPMLEPFVKKGGNVSNTSAMEVSHGVDLAISNNRGLERAGAWLVSNAGKHFILNANCGGPIPKYPQLPCGIIYGFFVRMADCKGQFWAGVQTYPTGLAEYRCLQPASAAHSFGPIADQDDCETTVVLVHNKCLLDDVETDTAKLYTDPDLAGLVLTDGKPLLWARHPQVPVYAGDKPEDTSSGPPRAVPPGPANGAHFIANALTPVAAADLAKLLRVALPTASKEGVCCLLAHWSLETGDGKATHCFNLTNVKAHGDGKDGHSWTYFACGEEWPLAYAQKLAGSDARIAIVHQYMRGNVAFASCKVLPDHPASCFRAFDSLEDGLKDYIAIMQHTFPKSWGVALAGDPRALGHWLSVEHFYTADEAGYTTLLQSKFSQYMRSVTGF